MLKMNADESRKICIEKMKQRLIDYRDINADIDNNIDRLERLEERMYSISPQTFGNSPKSSSPSNNKLLHLIEKKDALEKKTNALIKKRDSEKESLEIIVDMLKKPSERVVIYMRYFDDEEWDKIIEMMYGKRKNFNSDYDNYKQRVFRIHSSAISNMAAI